MNGIDLKMTPEDAVRLLGNETKTSIDRIRRIGENLAEELSAAFKARSDLPPLPSIVTAAAAAVIDFPFRAWSSQPGPIQMQLTFNGQGGGSVDLARGLPNGRYRALITIERLGDLEG